jgi:transposase
VAFREVSVVQIREALRRWLRGEGERSIAKGVGVDRKTARRYVAAAMAAGLDRQEGEQQLTDELIGQVVEAVRPHRPDGHGEAWRALLAEEQQVKKWVEDELTVVKIGILLGRKGVVVPHRTLARFAVERCGAGRRKTTVLVDDPPPGTELQVDFGRLGLVPDGERRRVCQGLVFTACYSRHQFVWPSFRQTTEAVIEGFEAAWAFFGGVFPVVIPDNMSAVVTEAENCAPRFNDVFLEYAQSRGFVVDAARVATPTDKALVSHCTSLLGSDRSSLVEPDAHVLHEPRVARRGRLEERLVLIVRLVGDEEPRCPPVLHRRRVHAEALGGLDQGEHAACPQTFGVAREVVAAT